MRVILFKTFLYIYCRNTAAIWRLQ